MRVEFIKRENGPERMVCEAELWFGEGDLSGLKLVGFSLWKSPDGEVYLTFPARAFGVGGDRRYFDFLRVVEVGNGATSRLKAWIIEQYESALAAGEIR